LGSVSSKQLQLWKKFLHSKYLSIWLNQSGAINGMKTILITGTTNGIGRVTATRLAEQGHHIVMANRNAAKATELAREITETTGNQRISTLPLDLSSMASVRECAREFKASHNKLDLLINNAGMMTFEQHITEDGLEAQFCVNNLAQLLLTVELLPALEAAAPAHVIFVTSMVHKTGKLNPATYEGWEKYNANAAYGQSKLAMMMNARELADRLESRGIAVNTLHPGAVNTGMLDGYSGLVQALMRRFFTTPEKGARTTLYLADMEVAARPTGKYFSSCKEAKPNKLVHNAAERRKLWEVSCGYCGIDAKL
jgi:NAD(P)-dependent dehydrogenase (short-subunit alcohol dehydrogenase family)